MATGFGRWELLQVPGRLQSMLRCLCAPSVVNQTLTEPADTQHPPEMLPSISKQEEIWQQHEPPQQELAKPGVSTANAVGVSDSSGENGVAALAQTASASSASSAAYVQEPSSDSSSSSYTGASTTMLAGSSSPPSACSSAGHSQVASFAFSRRWREFDSTGMEACRRSYDPGVGVDAFSQSEPEQQRQHLPQLRLQQPRSLHAASGGDYARLLQLRQLQAGPCHNQSITKGGWGTGRSSPLTHSASSTSLAYSSSPARSSTADTSRQHSEADRGVAKQLEQPYQQQQQQRAARPLTRTCSWPWLFGSSSSSSSSNNKTTDGATAAAGNNRRLLSEGGLTLVASAGRLHPAVQAHLQGTLGIAFSGGGFRFTYFVGVMDVLLHHLGLVGPATLLSGASSGALIAVFTKLGLPVERVMQLTDKLSRECSTQGLKGNLGSLLRAHLEANLPDDAHITCHNNTFMAVTQVWPAIRTRLFSSFPTRTDLINAMMASCHLPTLSDGSLTVSFNGRLHIDGGLLSVLTPPPGAAHSVHVCSMPSCQIAKLPAFISRPQQSDISISPDTFQPWPFTRSQTTGMALQPPSSEFIEHMVARGRADAMAWAETVGLTRDGLPVFPPAARLEQLRQEMFGTDGLPTSAATSGATLSAAALNALQESVLGSAFTGSSSYKAASQPAWELFYNRALQEGMLQQKQLEQQGLHCDTSQALAAEAATASAAKAAADDAAVVAAEVARALSQTPHQGLPGLEGIKRPSVPSAAMAVAASSSIQVVDETILPQQYPAMEMAGSSVLQQVAAAPTGPGSFSGSSAGQTGSSSDWQFLVAELGFNTNAEV